VQRHVRSECWHAEQLIVVWNSRLDGMETNASLLLVDVTSVGILATQTIDPADPADPADPMDPLDLSC
jgi:hypothetical protein